MKELGIITHEQTVVNPGNQKSTEAQIQIVTERAYVLSETNSPEASTGNQVIHPSNDTTTEHSETVREKRNKINGSEGQKTPFIPRNSPQTSHQSKKIETFHDPYGILSILGASGVAVGVLGSLGWILKRRKDNAYRIMREKERADELARNNKEVILHTKDEGDMVGTEGNEEEKSPETLSKNAERFHHLKDIVIEEFGFIIDLKDSHIEENGEKCIVFTKQTYHGLFKTLFEEDVHGNISVRFTWIDGIKEKYTTLHRVLPLENIGIVFEAMYHQALIERDVIKNKELLTLHTVEIVQNDLTSIYRQLEDPYVLSHGTETGGYWFQSCYGIKNGILQLEHLANPTLDEMELSGVEFAVVGKKGSDYFARNKTHSLFQTFGTQEANILLKKQVNTYLQSGVKKTIIMDGAINYYNWHKHPGGLYHPSGGDINHMSMGRGRFERQPNLQVLTWGIVNELPRNSTINERNRPSNSIIFRSSEYKGSRDYIMYFWKIHRNTENKNYRIEDLIPLNVRII